ncbi:MAG: ACT domain-containing protein [Actinobacteria bacterium]|nr:MAG: ACT domain-containing protein [Actinomycetota bacterium]
MAKDLLVTLDDRPGTLADLGEALGNAGVNIEGICGITEEGRGIIHLLVEDVAGARRAIEGAGMKVEGETDVIVEEIPGDVDQPGILGAVARKVADAGVNVSLVYLATNNRSVVATSDNEKARQARRS